MCCLCGLSEDTRHIFFHCQLALFMWSCVWSWLGVSWNPSSFGEVRALGKVLPSSSRRIFWIVFPAFCWILWTTRNKFTIEKVFPRCPADCLFKLVALIQSWTPMSKPEDEEELKAIILRIKLMEAQLLPWQPPRTSSIPC